MFDRLQDSAKETAVSGPPGLISEQKLNVAQGKATDAEAKASVKYLEWEQKQVQLRDKILGRRKVHDAMLKERDSNSTLEMSQKINDYVTKLNILTQKYNDFLTRRPVTHPTGDPQTDLKTSTTSLAYAPPAAEHVPVRPNKAEIRLPRPSTKKKYNCHRNSHRAK
ncbi:hypothetical protein DSO57_1009289 [Entomophthora muscae]|uniref:Uncharacterized protein n=1 Tax=Entomophthora muscae TaxID=34485 RepID=A0ACC2USY4_9FUNG|nr:hypothetical protein DSO57_1009289 [Entomophthora muscae]